MQETEVLTREEKFSKCSFEWVKTDRAGEVCHFQSFSEENGIEYVNFTDNSRIRSEFVGDIVLMHEYTNEIMGDLLIPKQDTIIQHLMSERVDPAPVQPVQPAQERQLVVSSQYTDPVISLLEKTKKRSEKITLVLTVKIPSPELYAVVRDNFDNTDDILLENIMEQIHDSTLREALKRELQRIYQQPKNKKNRNGQPTV